MTTLVNLVTINEFDYPIDCVIMISVSNSDLSFMSSTQPSKNNDPKKVEISELKAKLRTTRKTVTRLEDRVNLVRSEKRDMEKAHKAQIAQLNAQISQLKETDECKKNDF
jgi:uncharacterized protein YlxW (UPF0749 family)